MKRLTTSFLLLFITITLIQAQDNNKPDYYQIPDYPEKYTAETVVARMIDGLGFRYYWGTDSLTEKDLNFKPSEAARTSGETIDHIYGLSKVIVNATLKKVNDRSEEPEYTFEEKRNRTLQNFKTASDLLKACESNCLIEMTVIFKGNNGQTEFPFWNNINGPIADAIWHVGQIVTHRRTSGNPFNSKVSVLRGKLRE
jgi:hypothetical protein